jgi:allantoinase
MTDLVVRAERVLLDGSLRPAAVAVTRGVITAVDAIDAVYPESVVAVHAPNGSVLLPGFVDTHVHVNDPGTNWEGFATAGAAAAAAGITTLVDMPLDCDPVTTSVGALEIKRDVARESCRVDVRFWAGAVPDNLEHLAAMVDAGASGFKCFLTDSGNANFGHLTPHQLHRAMEQIAGVDSVLLVHAESAQIIDHSPSPSGERYESFLATRPDAAEEDAVALVMWAAECTGARAHVVHVSSARTLPLIADAKRRGVQVTAETCPHYLTFAAEAIPDGATEFAACPPIRGGADRERLWDGLMRGTLDMVVSDHSPCSPGHKGGGDFGRALGGVSSLQVGPRAAWTQAQQRGFGLAELSRWMSESPAALAGLTDRGRIEVGYRADLCLFDPDATEVVRADALLHRHPVTPYDGMTLRGSVLQTWVAGRPVYGELCESA